MIVIVDGDGDGDGDGDIADAGDGHGEVSATRKQSWHVQEEAGPMEFVKTIASMNSSINH